MAYPSWLVDDSYKDIIYVYHTKEPNFIAVLTNNTDSFSNYSSMQDTPLNGVIICDYKVTDLITEDPCLAFYDWSRLLTSMESAIKWTLNRKHKGC